MKHADLGTDQEDEVSGLYLPDCEIARKLGYGRAKGYQLLRRLDKGIPGFRKYPQPDPVFGKRFWPEVLQWHMEYHKVRGRLVEDSTVSIQPRWQENFDASPTDKTKRSERARA